MQTTSPCRDHHLLIGISCTMAGASTSCLSPSTWLGKRGMPHPTENYLNPALGSAVPQHPRSEHTFLPLYLLFPSPPVCSGPFTPVFSPPSPAAPWVGPSPVNQSPHTAAPPQTLKTQVHVPEREKKKLNSLFVNVDPTRRCLFTI